jgi:hypothetical protein
MNNAPEEHGHYWRHRHRGIWGGVILIGVGAVLLLDNLKLLNIDWDKYWPVFLIALGVWIVIQRIR